MATLWITALAKDQARVQLVSQHLKRYGLDVAGHFWTDDLEKFAWFEACEEMIKQRATAWLIVSSEAEIATASIRYGLSALALVVGGRHGADFPIALMGTPGAAALPTPLAGALQITEATPSWQAKLVALANRQRKPSAAPYRINLYANTQFGQWFEVGPATGSWAGAMFGVQGGGVIDFHAVGPKGVLPEKTVLNFAQKDMKLALGDKEYVAWAVQNEIGADQSYYVRVKGAPGSILFSPLAQGDDAEAFVLALT